MKDLFWLTQTQLDRMAPHFPLSHGIPRVDDLRVISGIIHVIKALPTPAHHTVDCRNRTVLNNPRKRPAVFVIELGRLAPSLAINQTIWAFAIEPEDPIADHLKSNIADPGRVTTFTTIVNLGQR